MTEIWRPVRDYENNYEVSNQGRVRNKRTGLVLIQGTSGNDGRRIVNLSLKGKTHTFAVHKLVAWSFLVPIPGKDWVLHDDGDYTNNWDTNLKYGTPLENSADMIRHGRSLQGIKNPAASFTEDEIREIRASLIGTGKLATKYNVTRQTIMSIRARRTWKHV